MLLITGAKDEKGRDLSILSGKILTPPKVKNLTGKKTGKSFQIVELFVKYSGAEDADYTINLNCWGEAARAAQRAHKNDRIKCVAATYSREWGGRAHLEADLGIGATDVEPLIIYSCGGIETKPVTEEPQQDIFTDIQQDKLPF
jgi:hypothetical protein